MTPPPPPTPAGIDIAAELAAACSALGSVMSVLASRRLIATNGARMNQTMYDAISAKDMPDAKLEKLAIDAFEAAAMTLAKLGHPGATVHTCTAKDMEP